MPTYCGRCSILIDWSEVLKAVAWADVIIVGEQHDDGMGHRVEAALAQDVFERWPGAALSLEMLERDEQPLVDDYCDGIIDAATLAKLSFSEGWGAGSEGQSKGTWATWYQPIIDAAKDAGARIVAANAPRRYVRLARTDGYARLKSLPKNRRRLFDLPRGEASADYYKRFVDVMTEPPPPPATAPSEVPATESAATQPAGHSGGASTKRIQAAFRSQRVWDATMAASIASARKAGATKVLHMVGQFHCDFEGGLVQELRRRLWGAKILVVSMQRDDGLSFREDDRNRADVVIYTGKRPAEPPAETRPAEPSTQPATTSPVPAETQPAPVQTPQPVPDDEPEPPSTRLAKLGCDI